ncbi:hypothetical protein F7725_020318 [Dissostichus mawsoni]|uniref:PiggyBac transposable element-derived protein domain-containing protein n=1 Tax=Dissostichus mawsoni TaxID=36200 RepID=A0A7J5YCY2_DISMA|nr:hypothetical protein F7725_020318 [Dissostichus mawsoni]
MVVKLLDRGIHYVGTARQANHNICAVKWYDSRAVTLVSSFAGPDPVQNIQRWDKANKTYVEIERPSIVGTYNKYMGGLDLLDSFTAKYKFPMKSRRWYVYIFWHTIILAVINAWLLYKRECKALKMPKQEILNRRQFQADLASSLILVKRSQPPLDVRKDLMAHFPVKTKRGRSRQCSKGYTNTQCTKCDVRLCFSDNRNCFLDYHCIHI